MLEHLKPLFKAEEKQDELPPDPFQKLEGELLTLGAYLNDGTEEALFDFKGSVLKVRGIPEDYKVFLDDKLVYECVYDTVYKLDKEVAQKLL